MSPGLVVEARVCYDAALPGNIDGWCRLPSGGWWVRMHYWIMQMIMVTPYRENTWICIKLYVLYEA